MSKDEKNNNFKHLDYIINARYSEITEYVRKQRKKKTPLDPETDEEFKKRMSFDYRVGDYAWYIPEKIRNVHPFMAVRCIIVDIHNVDGNFEYTVDEPVQYTIPQEKLYYDSVPCFAELQRIFYKEMSEYAMKGVKSFDLDYEKTLNEPIKEIKEEHFIYEYNDLKTWRYYANNQKEPNKNILTVKKERLVDWYTIYDFFDFDLVYPDN